MFDGDRVRRLVGSRWRLAVGVAAIVVLGVVVAGALLGSRTNDDDTSASSPSGGVASAAAGDFPIVVYQGADVLGGSEVDFNALLGQGKPVVLNFWAAQCPPCRVEMPWFEEAYRRHRDEVLLVGVDIGPFIGLGSNEQGRALLDELGVTYPAGAAVDDRPVRQYRVIGMPTTVFFDADGNQVGSHSGLLVQDQIDEAFRRLADGETP